MDRIVIIQSLSKDLQKQACNDLAIAGTKAGFDIIGIHKEKFDKEIISCADILIIIDISELIPIQKNELFSLIAIRQKPFVKCIMALNGSDDRTEDIGLCTKAKKNYFCSPKIFQHYIKLGIDGFLSFLAGEIDDSWQKLLSITEDIDHKKEKAITSFWRDIDLVLRKAGVPNG